MSATSIGYICLAAIICTALVTCDGSVKVSDEAVKAVSSTCEKTGMVAHVILSTAGARVECVKGAQHSASAPR